MLEELRIILDLKGNAISFLAQVILFLPKILLAIFIFFIGMKLVKMLLKAIPKYLQKRDIDPSISPFLISLFGTLLRIIVLLGVASTLGITNYFFCSYFGSCWFGCGSCLAR